MAERFEDYGIQGVNLTRKGDQKIYCPKPECASRKNKKDKSLSVSVEKGTWNCHHCGFKGALNVSGGTKTSKTFEKPATARQTSPHEDLIRWFQGRGIPASVLERNKIAVEVRDGKNFICFNYFLGTEIVNVKYRGPRKEFSQAANAKKIFYKQNDLLGQERIILCEGEIDALSFEAAGFLNAASIPDGAINPNSTASDTKMSFLAEAEEIIKAAKFVYIAMDSDAPGVAMREELARRIGRHKCLIVRYPDGCKDANDVLVRHGVEELIACYNNAAPYPIEGVLTPNDVYEDYMRLYREGHAKGARIKKHGLGEYLSFHPGQLTIITGIPSMGKSTFLDSSIILDLALNSNWTFAYFTPESYPVNNHLSQLAEQLIGRSFLPTAQAQMTEQEANDAHQWLADRFWYLYPDKEMFSLENIIEHTRELVLRYGINALVIDPWNKIDHDYSKAMNEEKYIARGLNMLHEMAKQTGIHIFVVVHPTKMKKNMDSGLYEVPTLYDCAGAAHWYNMAFIGLTIYRWFVGNPETGEVSSSHSTLFVQKVKTKWIGKLGSIDFDYQPECSRFVRRGSGADTSPWIELSNPKPVAPKQSFSIDMSALESLPKKHAFLPTPPPQKLNFGDSLGEDDIISDLPF